MTSSDVAPARPARPRAVTVAYWLQVATVAVLLLLICLVAVEAVWYDAQIDEALRRVPDADPTEVSGERTGNVIGTLFMGVPALLLAVWLAATALPLRRGSNVARIMVFVAAGGQLLLCFGQGCMGVVAIPFALALGDPEFDPADGGPDGADWEQSKFLDALYDQGDPSLVTTVAGGVGVLLVLLLTGAVVVLLLLPDSRRWFTGPVAPPAHWPAYGYGYGYAYPGQYATPALPPGWMICPDPAVHFAHPPAGPAPADLDGPGDASGAPDRQPPTETGDAT